MPYTKTTWTATTYITADKLNNLESQYDQLYTDYMYGHNHDTRYYTKSVADTTFYWPSFMGQLSGADADTLDTHHVTDVTTNTFPVGVIIMWTQAIETIPTGWHLCDGSSGTIDLRNKFVFCAGGLNSPGDTLGESTVTPATSSITIGGHTLTTSELPAHTHTFSEKYGNQDEQSFGAGSSAAHTVIDKNTISTSSDGGLGGSHEHSSGSSVTYESESNIPPYYAVYYVQRIS